MKSFCKAAVRTLPWRRSKCFPFDSRSSKLFFDNNSKFPAECDSFEGSVAY